MIVLLELIDLKNEERAWIELFGIEDGESVAGHSWSVAFLTLIFSSGDLDLLEALEIAILHDLAESDLGDIITEEKDSRSRVSPDEKSDLEEEFWEEFEERGFPEKLFNLWQDYDRRGSQEAKLVKDMDLLDLCLQAVRYEAENNYPEEKLDSRPVDLDEVFSNSRSSIQTEFGLEKFKQVKSNYERAKRDEEIEWSPSELDTAYRVLELKSEKRSGQQLYSIDDPDSIAAHSWNVAFLTIFFSEEDLDLERALRMALIHDLGEAEIGDFSRRADDGNREVSRKEKEELERKAVEKFSGDLDVPILELWEEYERCETLEARFVRDMDRLDSCITALKNEKEENYSPEENTDLPYENLDEFFLSAEGDFRTEKGRNLFKKIRDKYRKVKQDEI